MANIQQWVNIDPNDNNQRAVPGHGTLPKERCGPKITLKAKINRKKKGKPIYWAVQLGGDNVVKNVGSNAGWTLNAAKGGFSAPGFYEKLVPTNRKGWSITTFDLSECGGDEFTIKAYTKTKKGKVKKELKSDTYVVWRQLFYQVTRMGPSVGKVTLPPIPNISWGDVQKEYDDSRKPHNIRWTEVPASSPIITRHRSLYNWTMVKNTGLEGYNRAKEPLVLKVSLVDMLAERAQEDHEFTVVKPKTTYVANTTALLFDMNSADDKDDWYVSSSATRVGDASKTVTVGRNDFTKVGPTSISVTLPQIQKEGLFDFCREAKVKVSVNVFENWTLGFSWYNGIWVNNAVVDWGPPQTLKNEPMAKKVATMVHEFGHAIGMVAPASPFHYPTSHKHSGNHCWNGATDPSTFPAGDRFPSGDSPVCTMFGDNRSNTEKFCATCTPFVRSRKPSVDGKFRPTRMMDANINNW